MYQQPSHHKFCTDMGRPQRGKARSHISGNHTKLYALRLPSASWPALCVLFALSLWLLQVRSSWAFVFVLMGVASWIVWQSPESSKMAVISYAGLLLATWLAWPPLLAQSGEGSGFALDAAGNMHGSLSDMMRHHAFFADGLAE